MIAASCRPADADVTAALAETDRLRAQVATLLTTHHNLSTLLVSADNRTGELMKLLTAVRALIESRDAVTALGSLTDILVNIVGTDDFVIYAVDPREQMLVPIGGVGAAAGTAERVALRNGWMGEVVLPGELVLDCDRDSVVRPRANPDVAAVVPLKVLDQVVGAIVISRLLPHRGVLTGCDREILGLLGVYAATAIIAADRRAGWRELPRRIR